jgi:hypothetical protein
MRAFRVMRLFGRMRSLREIITSLTMSLIPMGNAFLIMLLVTSIYAILVHVEVAFHMQLFLQGIVY